ncbi:hypothetical protein BJX63DRAFT_215853 [Aspergillus granulosus]|uniref:Uncharacterized protein n=1 Tax=Aspergillus granulosus TaxID=176169 RepID=A0ABR4HDT1_9EURO
MPVRWKVLGSTVTGGAIGTGFWFFYLTRDVQFVPLAATDRIFRSKCLAEYNPNGNPTIHDLHIKRVPLERINPELLEDRKKLLERYCGGVWAGIGFAPQRILHGWLDTKDTTKHQIWSPSELLQSDYKIGTDIAGNFEVVDRSEESILIRGGDKTSHRGLRPLDGLIELSACINRENGMAEFGFKSLFFQGAGATSKLPMPGPVVWMHEQYAKALLASGIQYILK